MRLKLIKTAPLLIILFFILPISANAENQSVSSTELIENASKLDGNTVYYSGEVVGDILYRGDYAWINVSDGANAIGIYIPASEAKKIEYVGRYRVVGDTVSLTGTFHRACAQHGGDMDIHAETVNVTEKGHTVEDEPSTGLLFSAGALFLCALTGTILVLKKRL
jgi:hypothetical protein